MLRDTLKFLWLCTHSKEPLAPPKIIDEVWHLLILSTETYAFFCNEYFGTFIHHRPAINGTVPGLKEDLQVLHFRTLAKARELNDKLGEGPLSQNFLSGMDIMDWCCHHSTCSSTIVTEEVPETEELVVA